MVVPIFSSCFPHYPRAAMRHAPQLRGYLPYDPTSRSEVVAESAPADYAEAQALIAELAQRKQELMYELASYANMRSTAAERGQVSRPARPARPPAHACLVYAAQPVARMGPCTHVGGWGRDVLAALNHLYLCFLAPSRMHAPGRGDSRRRTARQASSLLTLASTRSSPSTATPPAATLCCRPTTTPSSVAWWCLASRSSARRASSSTPRSPAARCVGG